MITLPAFTPRLMTTIASITAVRGVFLLQLSQLEGMQKNITTVGVLQRTCRLIGSRCFVSDGTMSAQIDGALGVPAVERRPVDTCS